jgi:hypothetical protein
MGYLISDVLHFYHFDLFALYSIPLWTFWELAKNINRIQATDDMRMLALLGNVIGGNPQEFYNELKRQQGNIAVENDEEFDNIGMQKLRFLFGNINK